MDRIPLPWANAARDVGFDEASASKVAETANTEPNYNDLDPGIRATVRWLRECGFGTVDSGDGVSKLREGETHESLGIMSEPHVYILTEPTQLVREADRLRGLLDSRGFDVQPISPDSEGRIEIQATYDPSDPEHGVLLLLGLDDAKLFAVLEGWQQSQQVISGDLGPDGRALLDHLKEACRGSDAE